MIDMLYLCIERMFGLTNGCSILERICSRLTHMTLARSTEEIGDHLEEREDQPFVTIAENQAIYLRNELVEDLVVSFAKLWTMKYWISLE